MAESVRIVARPLRLSRLVGKKRIDTRTIVNQHLPMRAFAN